MRRRDALLSLALLPCVTLSCARQRPRDEIGLDRAIEIARGQISFQPSSIDAVKAISNGRAVWRVTIRGRLPGQPPGLFETRIVEIDRKSGEIVSIARS